MGDNVPVPRPRQRSKVTDCSDGTITQISYENVEVKRDNIKNSTQTTPVPAPRRVNLSSEHEEEQFYVNRQMTSPTGTKQKTSNIPRDEDSESVLSYDSGGSSRYKTSSPGDIMKSISSSSKLLAEAVQERMMAKTTKVKDHMLDTSKSAFKNVRKSINLSTLGKKLKKKEHKEENFDKRQTAPPGQDIFNKIQFHSPLNSRMKNHEDLSHLEEDENIYAIPHSNKRTNYSDENLPSYEDAMREDPSGSGALGISEGMYTKVVPKCERTETLNISKNNLSEEALPTTSGESSAQKTDGIYGKLNIVPEISSSDSSDEDNTLPRPTQRKKRVELNDVFNEMPPDSTRVTVDSFDTDDLRLFARRISEMNIFDKNFKSESWTFYDTSNFDSERSTPEPFYVNTGDEEKPEINVYGKISETEDNILKPTVTVTRTSKHDYDEVSIMDIIDEFDPLASNKTSGVEELISDLKLLEDLLGAENYGKMNVPPIPKRNNSLEPTTKETQPPNYPPPAIPDRKKKKEPVDRDKPQDPVIVHQNLKLPWDSIENLVDESVVEQYLAKVPETNDNTDDNLVDLSKPSTSAAVSKWYVNTKNDDIDPANSKLDTKKAEKHLNIEDDEDLPTYREAIADLNPLNMDKDVANSAARQSVKSKLSNVFVKKRKSSSKSETKTILEMIPKPPFTEKLIYHKGHLLKFPTGMMEDFLNELSSRAVMLQEKKLLTYVDTQLKETINLTSIVSIQCVLNHKFNNEGGIDIHCFEIVLAVPKNSSINQQIMSSNPNMMITNTNSGNFKTTRQSYIFGIHRKDERNIWMRKILQSITDVFPMEYSSDFNRAGWCYMKKSTTSSWSGSWILLAKRRLYFYNFVERKLEMIDLRKARCIGSNDSDDTTKNLHIEAGPNLFIDCPPYSTVYFIMNSPRETTIWRKIITDIAHNNGALLRHQQLTKNDVPVVVDKCINFVYTHGSMSEGIYRKSGSTKQVNNLLALFRQDAFAVQITRSEYTEHDVSGALKKFFRELPEALLGKASASFIGISTLQSQSEKLECYKELLVRLSKVEYQTLKKLLGHLAFISSLRKFNKMCIQNLAMIWGYAILHNPECSDNTVYDHNEAKVIEDLITNYKNLFEITAEEVKKEQLMMSVLYKYHESAETMLAKNSGDLKVWVTVDGCDKMDTEQINVTINPSKSAYDVCKELAAKVGNEAHKITLHEVILGGALHRPIHFSEKVLDIVLRWSYWSENDRKDNYLMVTPTKLLYDVLRTIRVSPTLTPTTELKYADKRTKSLKMYRLQFFDDKITVMKRLEKKDKDLGVKFKEDIDVKNMVAYLGMEKKRDDQIRWAITLVDRDFKTRTKEFPYIGNVFGGIDFSDQTLWYASILHCLYKENILPNPEIIIP